MVHITFTEWLIGNGMGVEGMIYLCETLKINTILTQLDISGMLITELWSRKLNLLNDQQQ